MERPDDVPNWIWEAFLALEQLDAEQTLQAGQATSASDEAGRSRGAPHELPAYPDKQLLETVGTDFAERNTPEARAKQVADWTTDEFKGKLDELAYNHKYRRMPRSQWIAMMHHMSTHNEQRREQNKRQKREKAERELQDKLDRQKKQAEEMVWVPDKQKCGGKGQVVDGGRWVKRAAAEDAD